MKIPSFNDPAILRLSFFFYGKKKNITVPIINIIEVMYIVLRSRAQASLPVTIEQFEVIAFVAIL